MATPNRFLKNGFSNKQKNESRLFKWETHNSQKCGVHKDTQVHLLLGRPFLATGPALIDVQKDELTLRVGNEAVHFKLNRSLEHHDVDEESCMALENNSLLSVELDFDCTLQHSINEIEMNFQYLESIDCEMLPSSLYNKETVLRMNENSQDNVCSQGQKTAEQG